MRPYLNNKQNKRAEDMVQVVEHLTSKHEALSSNSSTDSPQKSAPENTMLEENFSSVISVVKLLQ
jgi:hypothetical protein